MMQQPESQAGASSSSSSASTLTPSGSNGGSLFNADEVRFMDDSLSNADSFDPFTVGAPGFKVPNVLPANLGGIGSVPRGAVDASALQRTSASWTHRDDQRAQNGNNSFSPPNRQSHSPIANTNPNPARGGYGRDKAWQLQQLEALQAESQRYRSTKLDGPSSTLPDFSANPRTGSSLNMMEDDLSWIDQDQAQQAQQGPSSLLYPNGHVGQPVSMPFPFPTYAGQKMPGPDGAAAATSSTQDLGHLGLRFPSSHSFPAAPGNAEAPSKRQRKTTKGTDTTGMDCDDNTGPRRGRSPNARPPWTQPPDLTKMQPSGSQTGQQTASKQDTSAQQRGLLNIDIDAPYTYLPAPKPPPETVDLGKAAAKSNAIPLQISDAFFAPNLARFQPHLVLLRREQMKRKERGLSANIRKGDKKVNAKHEGESPDGTDGEGGKKKATHTLLTEAEKKANHIASEQKRRANIRKGYEMLCDLVPALREDGEGEGQQDEEGMDEDEDGDDEDVKRGKRRRGYETSGGGERIEGRTGPRSESAILMAAVDHLRGQLEVHRQLVIQKQDAQLRVAQRYGLDVRVDPSATSSSANK